MELPSDPIERFAVLYEQAKKAIPVDPNAMVVASVGADGRPSARVVLLKDFDARGFVFFTNYQSRKGARAPGASPSPRSSSTGPRWSGRCGWRGAWSQSPTRRRTRTSRAGPGAASWAPGPASRASRCPRASCWRQRVEELTRQYEGKTIPRPAALVRLPRGAGSHRVLALAPQPPARAASCTCARAAAGGPRRSTREPPCAPGPTRAGPRPW